MKLSGIKVVDLSSFLPGPYLTLAMADHGAEVIKIEAPGIGDHGRAIGPFDGDESIFFRNLNRGKKSVILDLKTEDGREQLLQLCDSADVFVESFRPGVMKRLGIDYPTIKARNPKIVYCSISAFGQDGPYCNRPAHDLAIEAISGLLSITSGEDDKPALPGVPISDLLAGLQGLSGVLMALLARQTSGMGDYIDISMQDATIAGCLNILGPTLLHDIQPVVKHQRTTGGSAFYRTYQTKDGRYIALAGQEPKFVRALLEYLKRPEFIDICLEGPGTHQEVVVEFFQKTFLSKSASEWDVELSGLDICYAVLKTFPEALRDENLLARQMIVKDGDNKRHIAPPIRFLNQSPKPVLHTPSLGQHNDAVLGNLRKSKTSFTK